MSNNFQPIHSEARDQAEQEGDPEAPSSRWAAGPTTPRRAGSR